MIYLLLVMFLLGSQIVGQDARIIAKNVFPSVVLLEMQDELKRPLAQGSGFFVRPDVVATNYHVIKGASYGTAKIVGEPSIYNILGVVGFDKKRDLALMRISGVNGKPLSLADISKIEVGQEIYALGNPRGLEGTISTGIISGSNFRHLDGEDLMQITAPISPGSSGGPVVNKEWEVIGVAVSSLEKGQNLNFAIPSAYLALLLANMQTVVSLAELNMRPPVGDSSVKQLPPSPPPSIGPSKPLGTIAVIFGDFKTYTHPNKYFSIDVPSNWTITDKSTPEESVVLVMDPSENAVVVIRASKRATQMTQAEETKYLTDFLNDKLSTFANFSQGEPKIQKNGSIGVYFKYDQAVKGVTFLMWGDAFVDQKAGVLGSLFFIIPNEQYELKSKPAYQMINSFKVNP